MNLSDSWDTSNLTTVLELFSHRLQDDPDFPFADFEGEVYSYTRLDQESTRLAHGLQALGVKQGDTVTSLLDNGPTPVVLMFARLLLLIACAYSVCLAPVIARYTDSSTLLSCTHLISVSEC